LIVLTTALLSGLLLIAVMLATTLLATLSGLLALLLAWLLLAALLSTLLAALLSLTALVLIHAVLPGCPSIVATVQNPTRSLRFRRCQIFVRRKFIEKFHVISRASMQ
jgi:hypothetical protein